MKDFDSLTLLLWFDCFLEAGAKILEKKFVGLLGDLKTPKGHFAISLVKSNFDFLTSEYMKFKDWLNFISVIYVFCNFIDFYFRKPRQLCPFRIEGDWNSTQKAIFAFAFAKRNHLCAVQHAIWCQSFGTLRSSNLDPAF